MAVDPVARQQVADLTVRVTALEGRMATAEGRIAAAEGRLAVIESKQAQDDVALAALLVRVDELEDRVEALESSPPEPPMPSGLLLDDFAVPRLNGDGGPLWEPYLGGGDPAQTGSLDAGTFRVDVGAAPSAVYWHFFPRHGGYAAADACVKGQLKAGTWTPGVNRLAFWVRTSVDLPRRADGGGVLEVGTYVRDPAHPSASDPNWQGRHFYHILDPALYAGRWARVVLNRRPQHEVGADPNANWPENPTAPGIDYFDGLTRWYWDQISAPGDTRSWWLDDVTLDAVAGEPDDLVASVVATYTGTRYEVTWASVKNVSQSYTVRFNGAAVGPVSNPGSAYQGCCAQSPVMAEVPLMTLEIQPTGSATWTTVAVPAR